ncbi:hypothetical protein AMTR_s00072p00165470 [Amborella trichopoda]|uniref:Uncharacterized protein n=1 Tax=Amborella trichopoda TaxID=13333 RepID=W1NRH5_AMBTC|nr:hypothetical protein AMTR_s00072p00165470 [Amborella trichopoda]
MNSLHCAYVCLANSRASYVGARDSNKRKEVSPRFLYGFPPLSKMIPLSSFKESLRADPLSKSKPLKDTEERPLTLPIRQGKASAVPLKAKGSLRLSLAFLLCFL